MTPLSIDIDGILQQKNTKCLNRSQGDITLNNLVNFLADLAVAPEKQLAFAGTPKQLLGASGLAELDRQLIERGDKDDIAIALGSELSVLAIAAADPVEDPFPDPDPSDPEPSESETE